MLLKNRFFNYHQAPLPLKISLPFILMFLGFWTAGALALNEFFSTKLDQKQQERAADLVALVEREFEREIESLRRDARIIASQDKLIRTTSTKDSSALQQLILPLKPILETDIISIVDHDQKQLLDTRTAVLRDIQLQDQIVIDLVLSGSDVASIVGTSGSSGFPVLIGTAPIKDKQGIIGGLVLGKAISHDLLTEVSQLIQEQLVVLSGETVLVSTFDASAAQQQLLASHIRILRTQGQSREFLAQSVQLEGLKGEYFDLVLLISKQRLNQLKRSLWLVVAILASLGSGAITAASYGLAHRIAQPIQDITAIARKVIQENNFHLQTTVTGQDEIGALANALNQLIQWVGQYTDELEAISENLEATVDARTEELAKTLSHLQETQAQLIQTEKMSSLGQMVAGIAHEINNPINFIQGNLTPIKDYFGDLIELLQIYQQEYPHPTETILEKQEEIDLAFILEDISRLIGSMKLGTQRVRDIVLSLRNYSRLDEAAIKNVDIHEGIDGTLLILSHRIKQGINVTKDYGALPLLCCSPAQLNQVFTNIIANALDAMLDADCEQKELVITTRTLPSEQIQVSIWDSGPGIPPEVKSKIFDPFFTTKAVGKGTGLGLGICFKIIQQHQGSIEVNTAPDKGTEFLITLPLR